MKLFILEIKHAYFRYDEVESVAVWASSAGEARRTAAESTVANVSWTPKHAYCHEVKLADTPKVVHTHFHHG